MSTQKPLHQRTVLSILICIVLFLPIEVVPMLVFGLDPKDPRPALARLALNLLFCMAAIPLLPKARAEAASTHTL